MSLQLSPENKQKLSKYVSEAVGYLQQVESLNEDVKNLAAIAKEEMEIPPAEFKAIVKAKYDADKVQAQVDKLQASLDAADSL